MKNKSPFSKGPSAYDIKKEAAKKYSKQQRQKRAKQKPTEEGRANKLNDELEYASGKLKGGSEKISSLVGSLLINLSGGPEGLKPGDHGEYVIDDEFDGDMNKLFQHVKFKDIPDNPTVNKIIDRIEEDPHMSPQQYSDYEKQYRSQAYNTLATRLNLNNFEALEQIMNSSPAWQLAKRSALDSDQVLERWQELYDVMDEAQRTDTGIFDWAIQQIENGKHTINWLLNAIDEEIKLLLAGKYSHRRKMRY